MSNHSKHETEAKSVVPSKVSKTENAKLMKLVERGEKILAKLNENEIASKYELGEIVRDAMAVSRHGDYAVATLAKRWHLDADTLRIYATVVRVWPKDEFARQAARRAGEGDKYRLSWSHFVLLAAIKDGRTRKSLINAAFAGLLSENALRAKRHGRTSAKRSGGRRKKHGGLVEAAEALAAAGSHLQSLLSDDTGGTRISIEQLKEAEAALRQIEPLLMAVQERIAQQQASSESTAPLPEPVTETSAAEQRRPLGYQEPAPVQFPSPAQSADQPTGQLPFQASFSAPAQVSPEVRIQQAPAPFQSSAQTLSNEALGQLKSQLP
jgi:hypothetical protein